jgi:membrane fusion protein, multidrug efflux system
MLDLNSTFRPLPSNGATRAVVAALGLIFAAATGCGRPAPLPPLPAPTVVTTKVVKTDRARSLRLSGTLEPERSVTVSFGVPGTVQQVLVDEGAVVKRGQVLARLVARSYEDSLGIAKVKSDQAEDAYRRLEPMHRNRTLPEIKMVEVEAGRAQARLAVSMARKNVEDTVLRAPEAGVVARRQVEAGTTVAPGVPAMTLVRVDTLLATAAVPEKEVGRCTRGAKTTVEVPALGRTFEGTVRDIAVLANPLTRSYDVKVAVANPDRALRVGMVADIHLEVAGDGTALVVPPVAVRVDEEGKPCVFVVMRDRTLRRRNVTVAGYVGENTAISAGLAEGDDVVISGTPMLADGMVVR